MALRETLRACPIRLAREKAGLNRTDLAREVGVPLARIIRWERGYYPGEDMLSYLADILVYEGGVKQLKKDYDQWVG